MRGEGLKNGCLHLWVAGALHYQDGLSHHRRRNLNEKPRPLCSHPTSYLMMQQIIPLTYSRAWTYGHELNEWRSPCCRSAPHMFSDVPEGKTQQSHLSPTRSRTPHLERQIIQKRVAAFSLKLSAPQHLNLKSHFI